MYVFININFAVTYTMGYVLGSRVGEVSNMLYIRKTLLIKHLFM